MFISAFVHTYLHYHFTTFKTTCLYFTLKFIFLLQFILYIDAKEKQATLISSLFFLFKKVKDIDAQKAGAESNRAASL